MNYSTCLKISRMLFGPLARVRSHNGGFRIYSEQGDTRTVHGEGATYLDAFKDAYLVPDQKSGSFTEPNSDPKTFLDPGPISAGSDEPST